MTAKILDITKHPRWRPKMASVCYPDMAPDKYLRYEAEKRELLRYLEMQRKEDAAKPSPYKEYCADAMKYQLPDDFYKGLLYD